MQDTLRQLVHFRQGNVLDAGFTLDKSAYHTIFCRNLLIYFDRETQRRVVRFLLTLLRPGGTLYVGPAEGGLLLDHGLQSNGVPLAFGFQQPEPARPIMPYKEKEQNKAKSSISGLTPVLPKRPQTSTKPVISPVIQTPYHQKAKIVSPLEEIAGLANQGLYAEAIRQYTAYLEANGQSAEAFYRLALAQDASGDAHAETNYRKAIYLDPNHQDAMAHLALLLDVRGNSSAAQLLRQRAARLKVTRRG